MILWTWNFVAIFFTWKRKLIISISQLARGPFKITAFLTPAPKCYKFNVAIISDNHWCGLRSQNTAISQRGCYTRASPDRFFYTAECWPTIILAHSGASRYGNEDAEMDVWRKLPYVQRSASKKTEADQAFKLLKFELDFWFRPKASRCAAARDATVKPVGCGFDPHSRRWNIYLKLN